MRKLIAVAMLLSVAVMAPAVLLFAQEQASSAPQVGDMAPDFTLQASDGKTYSLSDFRGQQAVVIAWYPRAFTRGCTIECKSLADNGHLIREYDVTYFMASVDPIEENTAFAAEQNADFPLLSDPSKETATAYGVLSERGFANRWTFYIGKDGHILYIDKEINVETSAEDMAARLGELGVDRATTR